MTLVELFSGCGGAALGLHRAGWEHLVCVEWARAPAATLRAAGFPGVQADVRTFPWREYRGVTAMWASPPCQAGSSAGRRRGAGDARNGWPWTFDAIDAAEPTWLMCENVRGWRFHLRDCPRNQPGLTCIGCYWEGTILPELAARFRSVVEWELNAADYGTPQSRRRVILVAGPTVPAPPPFTHAPADRARELGLRPHVSVREALPHLTRAVCEQRVCYPVDGSHGRAGSEPWRYDRPAPTVTTMEEKGTRASAASGWTFHGGPDRASDMAFLAAGIRRIEVREGLVLQGFPADWPLQGTVHEQYLQVGNAVPPPLSEAAGRAVLDAARGRG